MHHISLVLEYLISKLLIIDIVFSSAPKMATKCTRTLMLNLAGMVITFPVVSFCSERNLFVLFVLFVFWLYCYFIVEW